MSETATETAQNQTEAATSSQATATSTEENLLTAVEGEQKQATEGQAQETSTETKTETAKTEEKTETKTEGAPEKYEFKDADKMDPKVLEAFSESAKEANLTQDAAQKLLDKVAPALQAQRDDMVKAVKQQWTEATKTDKEFGGEKLQENLGIAKTAFSQFTTPELRTFLDETGLSNHPEIIRAFWKVGKAISEDKFVSGKPGGQAEGDPAKVLYDNTKGKD
jgi:hypothetical protein